MSDDARRLAEQGPERRSDQLRGRGDSGGYLEPRRRRVRLAYVQGAEARTRENVGRR
jgi:hypothetical protein